ncbi:hypothetical protein L6R50_07000 [Myxococcota bacterium]|nr:hypothetical protein [Myxococcota bacterium]
MSLPGWASAWIAASVVTGVSWQVGAPGALPVAAAPLLLVGALAGLCSRAADPGAGPGTPLGIGLAAGLGASGPLAAAAIAAAARGADVRWPGAAAAGAMGVALAAGIGVALAASRGWPERGSAPAVRMEGREVAPICGVCRGPAPPDEARTVRCGRRRRDDGRPCVGVYHRDHVPELKDGLCEYCNQPFRETRGGVA